MATKDERDRIIGEVVKFLYDKRCYEWTVQDKGVLVSAIKLQLEEKRRDTGAQANA